MYPCPPEKLGLNVIRDLRARYQCPVGLSDHSGTIYAGLAAAALGANAVEVHVCFSRECFGPDTPASLPTGELRQLVDGIRFIEKALANPVNKESVCTDLAAVRATFQKSVVAAADLPAGRCLSAADVAFKKPGTGIPAARVAEVLNRRLKQDLTANQFILEEHLE